MSVSKSHINEMVTKSAFAKKAMTWTSVNNHFDDPATECKFCEKSGGSYPKAGLRCGVCLPCALEKGVVIECIDGILGKGNGKRNSLIWNAQKKFISPDGTACVFCKEIDGSEPKIGLVCDVCFSCAIENDVFDACMSGTFDPATAAVKSMNQDNTEIHTLIFDRAIFNEDSARAFAEQHGFMFENAIPDGDSIVILQRAAEDFDPNGFGVGERFRTVTVTQGVTAAVGFIPSLKVSGSKPMHTAPLNDDGSCPTGFTRQGNVCVRTQSQSKQTESKREVLFTKVDDEKRLVTGPALVPNLVDLQGDFELKEDIELAAHIFMEKFRGVDDMHKVFQGIGLPVESWILREELKTADGRTLPPGTWMLTIKVINNSTWARVKNGELTGFSIVFLGQRESV